MTYATTRQLSGIKAPRLGVSGRSRVTPHTRRAWLAAPAARLLSPVLCRRHGGPRRETSEYDVAAVLPTPGRLGWQPHPTVLETVDAWPHAAPARPRGAAGPTRCAHRILVAARSPCGTTPSASRVR